jgi:hypothetical protein
MSRISRATYVRAASDLLQGAGFTIDVAAHRRLLARKDGRTLLIDVAGKNLPYRGSDGSTSFEWETWIAPARLDRLERDGANAKADPWFAFCYAIVENEYRSSFGATVTLGDSEFGARLISAGDFRAHMVPRSPSWGEVNLPRKEVVHLTSEPQHI